MTRVLTLRIGPPVTVAIALDYYKDPSSHEDPQQWTNTPMGELVHQGKYAGSDVAGKQLAAELAQFMQRHPDLQHADVIVNVPSLRASVREQLAKAVANVDLVLSVRFPDADAGIATSAIFTIGDRDSVLKSRNGPRTLSPILRGIRFDQAPHNFTRRSSLSLRAFQESLVSFAGDAGTDTRRRSSACLA